MAPGERTNKPRGIWTHTTVRGQRSPIWQDADWSAYLTYHSVSRPPHEGGWREIFFGQVFGLLLCKAFVAGIGEEKKQCLWNEWGLTLPHTEQLGGLTDISPTCHSHLAHQVYILLLILLCYQDVGPIGFEVTNFTHSKLLDLEYPKPIIWIRLGLGWNLHRYLETHPKLFAESWARRWSKVIKNSDFSHELINP